MPESHAVERTNSCCLSSDVHTWSTAQAHIWRHKIKPQVIGPGSITSVTVHGLSQGKALVQASAPPPITRKSGHPMRQEEKCQVLRCSSLVHTVISKMLRQHHYYLERDRRQERAVLCAHKHNEKWLSTSRPLKTKPRPHWFGNAASGSWSCGKSVFSILSL